MRKKKDSSLEPAPKIKRRYPEKHCKNSRHCISGGKFIPHDRRQEYCCVKCGENFRNDRRHLANQNEYRSEKELRSIDAKLQRIYERYEKDGTACVPIEIFNYEAIDISKMVSEKHNGVTNQPVKCFYKYGFEKHNNSNNFLIIHKLKHHG